MARPSKGAYEYIMIKGLGKSDKIKLSKEYAKRDNVRLATLEKAGQTKYVYKKVKKYLRQNNREKFYEGTKFSSNAELNRQLMELSYFLNAKTSTLKGIQEIQKERVKSFMEKGIIIGVAAKKQFEKSEKKREREAKKAGKQFIATKAFFVEDEKSFFDFLSGKQFDTLSQQVNSADIIEDFVSAMEQGFTLEEIQKQYGEFLKRDKMTFEQTAEVRKYILRNKTKKGDMKR